MNNYPPSVPIFINKSMCHALHLSPGLILAPIVSQEQCFPAAGYIMSALDWAERGKKLELQPR